jgi:hypothetical protein
MTCNWKHNFHTGFKTAHRGDKVNCRTQKNFHRWGGGDEESFSGMTVKPPEGTFSNLERMHKIKELR